MDIKLLTSSSRRKFIRQITVGGLSAAMNMPLLNAVGQVPIGKLTAPLPTSYLIKNAYVLSMDKTIGDLQNGDILIENGIIAAVRPNISNNKSVIIDGTGMIALPGFVETHWHLWTSLMRAMAGSIPNVEYFAMSTNLGKLYTPENTYHSTRLALAEAISSGITHVHDWNHNVISAEHAKASLIALQESGIRARFSVGVAAGKSDVDLNILKQLNGNWSTYNNNGLINLGLAWPGIENNREAGKLEIRTARELNLPISVHVGRKKDRSDSIINIAKAGLLGKDLQVIHGIDTTVSEYKTIADSGTSISASPFSELKIGYGLTPVVEMLNCGAPLGFSVDTMPLTGNADMFAIMKIFLNLANGISRNEFQVTARRILEIATIEGARSMGISDITGSLTSGKQADVQLINTRAINLGIMTDPISLLTVAAQPQNVDTVIVRGRILKKSGKLTYTDTDQVIDQASLSLEELRQRAK